MATNNKESRLSMDKMHDIVIINLSPLKHKVETLNEMEKISGQFVDL